MRGRRVRGGKRELDVLELRISSSGGGGGEGGGRSFYFFFQISSISSASSSSGIIRPVSRAGRGA
jgi:hypothetical protein